MKSEMRKRITSRRKSKIQAAGLPVSVSRAEGRMLRGGSFDAQASYVRCASRVSNVPTFRAYDFGFRPARTIVP
jgi:formylglycine-generating enzyme required for sulfatase activity